VQAASTAIGLHLIETGFANASSGYPLVMIGAFAAFYFCELTPRIGLLVFVLVSAAIEDENNCKFKWLW
jgi:hypothetical protein